MALNRRVLFAIAIAILGGLSASSPSLGGATPTVFLCPIGLATPECNCAAPPVDPNNPESAILPIASSNTASLCFFTRYSDTLPVPVLSTNAGGSSTDVPPTPFGNTAKHCLDANGTELCGFQLDIHANSGASFSPADPPSSIQWRNTPGNPPGTLRLNWVAAGGVPLSPIFPHHLGTISVTSDFSAAALNANPTSRAVRTNLTLVSVHHGPIAVPEPSSGPLWGAGLLALGLLISFRFRRPGLLALGLLVASLGTAPAEATLIEVANRLGNPGLGLADPSDLGTVIAGVGDLNGDGVEDLAIGLPNEFGGSGGVLLAFLRHDGTVNETQMLADGSGGVPSGSLAADGRFGSAIAILTDIDGPAGPGAVALAVSAPSSPPTGALWLLILSPGTAAGSSDPVDVLSVVEVATPVAVEALAAIGDVNANNVPDLALGHPSHAGTSCPGTNCGAFSVLHLGPAGVGNTFLTLLEDPNGPADQAFFGAALAGVGVNANYNLPQLAVGAPGYDNNRGAVSILFVGDAGYFTWGFLLDDASGILPSPLASGDRFGAALSAIGDLDNNGLTDIVAGLPGRQDISGGQPQAGSVAFLRPADSGWPSGFATELNASGGELPEAFGPTVDGTPTEFGRALAAVDQDGDGDKELWVGATADVPMTSAGIVWRISLFDPDGDLLPDDLGDNCPGTHNPDQLDSDADGVGDECDNCPAVANGNDMGICTGGDDPSARGGICFAHSDCGSSATGVCALSQKDADADGVGDACEQVVVRLKESAPDDWSLEIDCGAHNVEYLLIALFAPDSSLPLDLDLGGNPLAFPVPIPGCADPGIDFSGAGAPGGTGCNGAPGIGATVAPSSGAIEADAFGEVTLNGVTTSGLRPNALYVWLEGAAPLGPRRLCQAGDQGVFLANLEVKPGYSAPTDLAISGSNDFGSFDFITTPEGSLTSLGSCIMKKPYPNPAQRGPAPPQIFIKLSSKPSQPGDPQAWEVCFKTDAWMHRIKLAVGPPTGKYKDSNNNLVSFDRTDITWLGCDNPQSSLCEQPGINPYPIDPQESSMEAPGSGGPHPDTQNRRYMILTGNVPGWSGRLNSVLNSSSDLLHCVGSIEVENGTNSLTHAPTILMADPHLDSLDSSQVDHPAVPQDVDLTIVENSQGCSVFEDNDNDGVRVEADNCPHYSNSYQEDLGGWDPDGDDNAAGLGQDGIGDACQCGEGDGDGVISLEKGAGGKDLPNLRAYLLGDDVPSFNPGRCNIQDDSINATKCNILDAVVLQRAFEGATTLPDPPLCAAANVAPSP